MLAYHKRSHTGKTDLISNPCVLLISFQGDFDVVPTYFALAKNILKQTLENVPTELSPAARPHMKTWFFCVFSSCQERSLLCVRHAGKALHLKNT